VYGICNLSLVPCRKEASDKSELVTQLLFGEQFTILESSEKWSHIRTDADGYVCWIDNKQFLPVSANIFNIQSSSQHFYTTELVQVLQTSAGVALPILLGSTLPGFDKEECMTGQNKWSYDGQFAGSEMYTDRSALIETSLLYLHAPYLWGGRTPFGIDCSGFTQMVYLLNGKRLKRDAWQQAQEGTLLSFIEEAETGDLAFFDNAEGHIIHVGIIMNESRIIHASGKVRIDKFDHHGIFNAETGKYSHNLRMIRKVI
jgi:cell wall-associated NlpC family hydrolase